ncbi:hypothetical protein O3P69_001554 [Scylla paramamosain]|uniref:Uncharacterized protein n=1 Tax=Scylla paramamosain TaxID=85552 RepID=A0AAW0UYE6_SCYPA
MLYGDPTWPDRNGLGDKGTNTVTTTSRILPAATLRPRPSQLPRYVTYLDPARFVVRLHEVPVRDDGRIARTRSGQFTLGPLSTTFASHPFG